MKRGLFIILVSIIFILSSILFHVDQSQILAQSENGKKSMVGSVSKIFKDVQGSVVQITRENHETSKDENVTTLGSGFVLIKRAE